MSPCPVLTQIPYELSGVIGGPVRRQWIRGGKMIQPVVAPIASPWVGSLWCVRTPKQQGLRKQVQRISCTLRTMSEIHGLLCAKLLFGAKYRVFTAEHLVVVKTGKSMIGPGRWCEFSLLSPSLFFWLTNLYSCYYMCFLARGMFVLRYWSTGTK